MSKLMECLGKAASRYGMGTPLYAMESARCYAQHKEERVLADTSKVSFYTEASWKKVSHDLLKYLMECGKSTANCARAAQKAFLSTSWERKAKVVDVADTVFNLVDKKLTCGEAQAQLAQDWINTYLNARLSTYRQDPRAKPEPIKPSGGLVASGAGLITKVLGIPSVFGEGETQKDTLIKSINVDVKGDEVTVEVLVKNYGKSTEEVKAFLYIGDSFVDEEPDTYWKNIKPGKTATIKLTTNWKMATIEKAWSGRVYLKEQHLGQLDTREFSLGVSGWLAWFKGLGWKAIALIGLVVLVVIAINIALKSPQAQTARRVIKEAQK